MGTRTENTAVTTAMYMIDFGEKKKEEHHTLGLP
jgi:hypothetical protein